MPLTVPELLRPHLSRPVAVLGAGVSGQGARSLVAALGGRSEVYDERGAEFTAAAAAKHRLVVFSPGFASTHPWLLRAGAALCLGELDFAALCWRGRILAVTGTNGKTTLTEFLAHALAGLGRAGFAAGNIGHAFSRAVAGADGGTPDSIAVCEVSSFQAETLRHFRADAALWTNFAEDHLERHPGLAAYFEAKACLAARAARVFAGSSVRRFAEAAGLAPSAFPVGNVTWVPTENQDSDPQLAGTVFAAYPQRENFLLAAAWWREAGYEMSALHRAARTFRLGRHRMARIAEIDGVAFWNDSKATNFHAVEAALARFDAPVLLIAGGKSKGGDLAGFVRRIAPRVRHAYLIGETSAALAAGCAAAGVPHTACLTLDAAVRGAAEAAGPGDHVVLSPGFSSFDMFKSYEDRGDQFERIARESFSSIL